MNVASSSLRSTRSKTKDCTQSAVLQRSLDFDTNQSLLIPNSENSLHSERSNEYVSEKRYSSQRSSSGCYGFPVFAFLTIVNGGSLFCIIQGIKQLFDSTLYYPFLWECGFVWQYDMAVLLAWALFSLSMLYYQLRTIVLQLLSCCCASTSIIRAESGCSGQRFTGHAHSFQASRSPSTLTPFSPQLGSNFNRPPSLPPSCNHGIMDPSLYHDAPRVSWPASSNTTVYNAAREVNPELLSSSKALSSFSSSSSSFSSSSSSSSSSSFSSSSENKANNNHNSVQAQAPISDEFEVSNRERFSPHFCPYELITTSPKVFWGNASSTTSFPIEQHISSSYCQLEVESETKQHDDNITSPSINNIQVEQDIQTKEPLAWQAMPKLSSSLWEYGFVFIALMAVIGTMINIKLHVQSSCHQAYSSVPGMVNFATFAWGIFMCVCTGSCCYWVVRTALRTYRVSSWT